MPSTSPYANPDDSVSDSASASKQRELELQSDGRPVLLRRMLLNRSLAVALVVVAELLAIAWIIAVPFIVGADTLHSKYTFTPRSMTSYTVWRIAAGVVVLLVVVSVCCTFAAEWLAFITNESKASRTLTASTCVVYAILLLVGNLLSASETTARNHYESTFAVKFNDFYCDTRTLLVCLEGTRDDILVLARGNATTVQATENSMDVALSIWSLCQKLILRNMAKADEQLIAKMKRLARMSVEKPISTKPLDEFLDDCGSSRDVDLWCSATNRVPASVTELPQNEGGPKNPLALPSPYASNPKMFASYTREWVRTIQFSNAFLGGATACLFLSSWVSW